MLEEKPVAEMSILALPVRIILYVVAWASALLAIDVRLWPGVYVFPMGLFAFIPPRQADAKWYLLLLFFGWAIYVTHAVLFFRARRAKTMWILYGTLLLLLLCNVRGCQQMNRNAVLSSTASHSSPARD